MLRFFFGSLNACAQYPIGRCLPSSYFWSRSQPIWRSHASVSCVNSPFLSGSVRSGGEINISFKTSRTFSFSSLAGPSSFTWVFSRRLKSGDATLAKLGKNRLQTLHSPRNDDYSLDKLPWSSVTFPLRGNIMTSLGEVLLNFATCCTCSSKWVLSLDGTMFSLLLLL